jgi:hypothetical protein
MANSYLPETLRGTAAVSGLKIATLIGSLSRSVELLTVDIEHEEARAEFAIWPTLLIRCWRGASGREGITSGPIAMLENLRTPKASALDTTERKVA